MRFEIAPTPPRAGWALSHGSGADAAVAAPSAELAGMPDDARIFLCSYWPLCKTAGGRKAVLKYGLPPFVNGLSRREPDFEHPVPAITASSRGRNFAPRLRPGDTVVYTTTKGRWGEVRFPHWRLVAVLEVAERFETHTDAADWYRAQRLCAAEQLRRRRESAASCPAHAPPRTAARRRVGRRLHRARRRRRHAPRLHAPLARPPRSRRRHPGGRARHLRHGPEYADAA